MPIAFTPGAGIAGALPDATPGQPVEQPAHSFLSLLGPPVIGWALCGALMMLLLKTLPVFLALAIHAMAAPLIFVAIARSYFHNRGAGEPLSTAVVWTSTVIALDAAVVAGLVMDSFAMFASVAGTWLPFLLIFAAVWSTGYVISMLPDRSAAA